MTGEPGPIRRRATIRENGRAKAYRPLPEGDRRAALAAMLEAYDQGDFFLAHEILEPAWMGASDPAERALHSGLIKLAAGFVHAVRGNPKGVEKNLVGARERLRGGRLAGPAFGVDVGAILDELDGAIATAANGSAPTPIQIRRLEARVP